ncbi:MAG: prepilin-type N-terminal cleavage/methylation domain-containing protein [Actinomycetota bacterium]|nr:prepilin-type N-terminal cleavage/methylation domain-containing protein [Actinomycetota bacterium]
MTKNGADVANDGFTMVELVVSLTILAIGIVGVIGVMNSSFGVAVRTNERSRAVALATREIEALRAEQYDLLATSPTATTRTEQVGGTTFTVEKAVVWGNRDGNPKAVKSATVAVRWSDGSGTVHDVSQSTDVYPGGLGPAATTPTTASCTSGGTPTGPTLLVASLPTDVLADVGVDLVWTPALSSAIPVATWRLEMSTNNFTTAQVITTSQPVSAVTTRVEGLSAGTAYQFRVAGLSACSKLSAWSPIATITTATAASATCSLGTPNVTPAAVKRANNGNNAGLAITPRVTANTTGNCSGLYVRYQAVAGVSQTQLLTGVGAVYSVSLTSNGAWDIGVHTLDLFDGANIKRGSLLLTVCAHNAVIC